MVRASQRGAGIPMIKTKGKPSSSDQAIIQTIGRTLTHMNNGYVAYDMDKMEVTLEELKGQSDNSSLLDFLNREIFFGMMSEFSTSGIGGNGSRAATSEHKSTYELQANSILQALESNIQKIIDFMIEISFLSNIQKEEYPEFHFNAIKEIDLFKVSQTAKNLYDSMIITKQPSDEAHFRELFGYPEATEIKTPIGPVQEENEQEAEEQATELKKLSKRDLSKYELEIFELESANETYLNTQEKTEKILNKHLSIILDDIAEQYERKQKFFIPNTKQELLINDLSEIYQAAFSKGETDVKKELNKLSLKTKELSLPGAEKKAVNNSISRFVKRLIFNVKTVLEDSLSKVTDSMLNKAGGLKQYVMGFETGFKIDKRTILSTVEDGYTDGRGKALVDNSDEIELYFYSATLDKNLCDECAPLDALELTLQEVRDNELRIGNGRVNPNCLGNNGQWCRCQLVPIKIKGE